MEAEVQPELSVPSCVLWCGTEYTLFSFIQKHPSLTALCTQKGYIFLIHRKAPYILAPDLTALCPLTSFAQKYSV